MYLCTTSIPGVIKNARGAINGKNAYARITIRVKVESIGYFFPPSIKSRALGMMNGFINGKETYRRILIRRTITRKVKE